MLLPLSAAFFGAKDPCAGFCIWGVLFPGTFRVPLGVSNELLATCVDISRGSRPAATVFRYAGNNPRQEVNQQLRFPKEEEVRTTAKGK